MKKTVLFGENVFQMKSDLHAMPFRCLALTSRRLINYIADRSIASGTEMILQRSD